MNFQYFLNQIFLDLSVKKQILIMLNLTRMDIKLIFCLSVQVIWEKMITLNSLKILY